MYSSSESISPVVTGVGGAAGRPAEATIFFWGGLSAWVDVIVASAAFRFLVVGGIVAVVPEKSSKPASRRWCVGRELVQHAKRGPDDGASSSQVHGTAGLEDPKRK